MVDLSKEDFREKSVRLGSGTQGKVYMYPIKTKSGDTRNVAVKIYSSKLLEDNDLQIETHLQRLLSAFKKIDPKEQKIIRNTTTFIIGTIKFNNKFKGYFMPMIPQKYRPKKKSLYSDKINTVERTLAYALNDDDTRKRLQEPIINALGRKIIVLKLLTLFTILHKNNIYIGDISSNNILIYVDEIDQKKNSIMVLDTDSFRTKSSMFPLNQPHTTGWIPPECKESETDFSKFFQDDRSDVWKMSILVLRLYYFGPQRTMIEDSNEALRRIASEISKDFSNIIKKGLSPNPDDRPNMAEMLKVLKKINY